MNNKPSKKELRLNVGKIHRSTKTIWNPFSVIHIKLRQKYRWYYRWHLCRLCVGLHWVILAICIAGLSFLVYQSYVVIEKSRYIENHYTIVGSGKRGWGEAAQKIHLHYPQGRLQLSKESSGLYQEVGIWLKKIDIGEKVVWNQITWQADVPPSSKIQFRLKFSNEDLDEEGWEAIPWSGPYTTSLSQIEYLGELYPRYRYVMIEIFLEGNGKVTPSLLKVDLTYITRAQPGKITAWLQDKIRRYLPSLFERFWHTYEKYAS